MTLLDTVVVSEPCKARPDLRVIAWMRGLRATDVFVGVVTVGEIERGIHKLRHTEFALALTRWFEALLRLYGDRILPVTPDIARCWGRLSADIGHESADLFVAATAAAYGLPWRPATCAASRQPA